MEENKKDEIREENPEETVQEDAAKPDQKSGEPNPEIEASGDADQEQQDTPAEEQDGAEEPGEEEALEDSRSETDEAREEPGHQGQEDTVRRGLFGKKKKDKRDQQIEELTDRVQRQMAEFDNFRKRSEKEKSAMYEIGARSVIEKILPTVDNFERGFAGLTDEQKEDPFVQGMEKVYRQMLTTLEGIGVTAIEAVGKPFDPNFHNAVMHVEDEEAEENVVVEEFQKGYMYRDSVVRHSMVKVAN